MRRLRRALFFLLLCLLLCVPVSASQITSLRTQAAVQPDGACQMELEAVLSLDEALDTVLIPLGFGASDAALDGVAVDVTKDHDGFCFLSLTGGFSGTKTVRVSYTIKPTQKQTDDGLVYTLPLIPGRWSWPIQSYEFTVTLPAAVEALEPVYESGYTQDVIADYMTLHQTDTSFSGTLKEELLDRETLSASVTLPADYFGTASRKAAARSLPALRAIAVIFWALGLLYWFLALRMRQNRVRRRALPPDGTSAGLLPLLLYNAPPQAAGILMQWCALGYVSIQMRKRQVTLVRQMGMGNERPAFEAKFFATLFAGTDRCGAGRFLTLSSQLEDTAARAWRRRLLDRNGGNPLVCRVLMGLGCGCAAAAGWHTAFGGLLFTFAGLVLGVAAGISLPRGVQHAARRQWADAAVWIATPLLVLLVPVFFGGGLYLVLAALMQTLTGVLLLWGPRRTRAGLELLAQARGLSRDLSHLTKKQLRARLREDGQYFYTMLPYAVALGRGGQFVRQFDSIILEPCGWLAGSKPCSAEAFYTRYRRMLNVITGVS